MVHACREHLPSHVRIGRKGLQQNQWVISHRKCMTYITDQFDHGMQGHLNVTCKKHSAF